MILEVAVSDTTERSIHVFELIGNMRFDDIKKTLSYIRSERQRNPDSILYNVSETIFLYMSHNGTEVRDGKHILWIKFGWARRSGLPETLDVSQGRTEFLQLPSGIYLYEPSHFVIFQHGNRIIMLQEFNFFGPRVTRLCVYLTEFFRKLTGKEKIKLHARRVFMKDVDKLLREYTVVKSIRIVVEPDSLSKLSQALGESMTALEVLKKPKPKKIAITLMSGRGDELEMSIDEVLELFHKIEEESSSFKLKVKKSTLGRTIEIDLKRHSLIFRKRFKYARDEEGNVYRSTDTDYAIRVLLETIKDTINAIEEK